MAKGKGGKSPNAPTQSKAPASSSSSKTSTLPSRSKDSANTASKNPQEQPVESQPCIRCPTLPLAKMNGHNNDFRKCLEKFPNPDSGGTNVTVKLWWGFAIGSGSIKDAHPAGAVLSKRETCEDILEIAKSTPSKQKENAVFKFKVAVGANQGTEDGSTKAKEDKDDKNIVNRSVRITKSLLEEAMNIYLSEMTEEEKEGEKQKQAKKKAAEEEAALNPSEVSFFQQAFVTVMPGPKKIKAAAPTTLTSASYDAKNRGFPMDPRQFLGKQPDQADLNALRTGFARPAGTFEVFTNHFMLDIPENVILYEYVVHSDSPEWENATRNKRKVLINSLINKCPELRDNVVHIASDARSKIIAVKELLPSGESKTITVTSYRRGVRDQSTEIKLSFKLSSARDLNSLRNYISGQHIMYEERGAVTALNIILAKAVTESGKETFQLGNANKFYYRPGWEHLPSNAEPDGHGLIAMRGYTCSVRPGMGCATLNINTATSAFYYAQTVHEFVKRFGPFPDGAIQDVYEIRRRKKNLDKANDYLKGLRVYVNFERKEAYEDTAIDSDKRRTKTLNNLATYASQVEFTEKNGNKSNILDYLKKTYPKQCKDSKADELAVNVGSDQEPKYYLSGQLRVLSDQLYRDKVPSHLVPGMITFARRPPDVNRNAILDEGFDSLGLRKDAFSVMLKTLGIGFEKEMMAIPARRVPPPTVWYETGAVQDIDKGSWSNQRQQYIKVSPGYRPDSFNGRVHVIEVNDPDAKHTNKRGHFRQNLTNLSTFNGLQELTLWPQDEQTTQLGTGEQVWNHDNLKTKLLRLMDKEVDLFVLFLPSKDAKNAVRHAVFKSTCEQILGIQSAVLCEDSMVKSVTKGKQTPPSLGPRILGGYFGNVTMKLNLRLGNVNHVLDQKHLRFIADGNDCMILGADVTHPSGGSTPGTPSIAALVGSIDNTFAPFRGSMRHQTSRQELIADIEGMTAECLDRWADYNDGALPQRILYYRDGVSESQYALIRQEEIPYIRQALEDAYQKRGLSPPGSGLKITAVVVAKRHNTRFYHKPGANGKPGKNGNVQNGTVVDSSITSPYFMDFYLQSHNPLEGSGKPAHYFVLENEMGFSPQQLQDLTNNLCYSYERSTTAVSYVPAAYYADRLCERGRQYLKEFFDGNPRFRDMTASDIKSEIDAAWYRGQHNHWANPWHPNLDDTMFWM